MTNLQSKVVSLQVDVSEVSEETRVLRDGLVGLQKEVNQVGIEITKAFQSGEHRGRFYVLPPGAQGTVLCVVPLAPKKTGKMDVHAKIACICAMRCAIL